MKERTKYIIKKQSKQQNNQRKKARKKERNKEKQNIRNIRNTETKTQSNRSIKIERKKGR
jgi:hypothetical protein